MPLATRGSLSEAISLLRKSQADIKFDNTVEQIILIGIASGMMFLHNNNIAHCDLKPDNILLDDNYHPLIADFGLSKNYNSGHTENSMICGTAIYIPPEELSNNPSNQHSKEKADVYSFGILMYKLLTLSKPYPDLDLKKITQFDFYSKVIYENYRPIFKVPIEPALKKLIERCWDNNIETRPTFKEIFELLSTNEDYFLPNINIDDIEDYIDELNSSVQKVYTEKVKIETLKKNEPKGGNNLTNEELNQKIMKLELQNENILKIVAQQEKLITNIQQKLIEETAQKQQYEKKFMEQQEKQKQCEILLADLQKTLNNDISSRKKLEDETRKQNDAINDLNSIIHNLIKKQNISDAMETMDEETTVFIQNIPYDAKAQDIKRVFSKFGDVKDVRILKESVYDREFSKGVGFVEFILEDSAIEAINDSENIEIQNRKIKVEFAIPEGSRKGSILNAFETRKGPDNGLKKFL